MKSIRLAILFLFLSVLAGARNFDFPDIRSSAKDIDDFIPEGWTLMDSVSGDLNKDGFADKALVIEYDDSVVETRPNGCSRLDHPRILLVLLKNASGKYTLALQDNSFLYRTGEAGLMHGDPYEKMDINGDTLSIDFMRSRGHMSYDFVFKDDDLWLISAYNSYVSTTGTIDEWEFDFVNQKAIHILGAVEEKDIYEVHSRIPCEQLKTLDDLKMPQLWEVFQHVFI
jgi:hypothetical protein